VHPQTPPVVFKESDQHRQTLTQENRMTMTRSSRPSHVDQASLVLRLVIGVVFAMHGWQKIFTYGLGGITTGFSKMGVPIPGFTGPAVGILELVGGVALIVGLFGRLIPLLLAIDMLGAIIFVHGKNGFFLPTGYEFVLVLLGASAALALTGAGQISVDAMVGHKRGSRG
jgi:putative oxidoreductase